MKKKSKKKRIAYGILCGVLAFSALLSFCAVWILGRILPSQREAQRWQGEGDTLFGQVSCYLPVDEKISLNQVYEFRYKILDGLHDAGFEADTDTRLFHDAWSTTGKVTAVSSLGHGEASAIAVGGGFFDFHPIRLLNGNYITETDLMQDRVLLDEELAWLLFGGTDLQGMELRVNGVPMVVAGVVEREQDFASKKAYTAGMGLYLSYETYAKMDETAGISCYELVMAEPVQGFTFSFAQEKFPIGAGEIVENSHRYSFERLLKLVGRFGSRSMQTLGVVYPYWENAARSVEDWCSLLVLAGLICAALPVVSLLVTVVLLLWRGKEKLEEDVFPKIKDGAEEAVRKQQRKRWEKRQEKRDKE